ncbi:M48 family metallopeptidase [Bacillus solitudinis]|uniref:M48 family metallopeptidase n=1 Tax=Bacillus solitudinis TaxID=2014074 RepID=UPI0018E24ED8|nr:M48 family metallopeptidase [Bacillus solitudinis]
MDQTKPLLVHKHENLLYALCILVSIIIVISFLFSIIGAVILFGVALISLISHIFSMAHIQINGVLLRDNQFPGLYNKVEELSRKMELRRVPEVYVIESGGMLNAFATKVLGYFGKNMIVLYSDFVDIAYDSDEFDIDYVIAHELSHLKRNHIVKNLFVIPAMWIPFIGTSYLRMAEYTCDRMAAYYTDHPQNAINGLLVLAAGRRLFKEVNLEAYLNQYNEKKGLLITVAELLSTHPPIPKRIHAIEEFMFEQPSVSLVSRMKQMVIVIIVLFLIFPALVVGIGFATVKTMEEFDYWFSEFMFADYTPLMEASMNGEKEEVERLLIEGSDPNELSEYGETPLITAIDFENTDIVQLLIEYGADPNLKDEFGWIPLNSALMMEDLESVKILLDAGADPYITDAEGDTAIDLASELGLTEFMTLLQTYDQ